MTNKILIVDDSHLILKSHAHTVRKATDADLLMVCSGEDGIETLQEHPDISLILLDLTMPGMDGLEFLEQLKTLSQPTCNIPVIIVSSSDDKDKMVAAASLGAKSYVTKPLSLEEILVALRALPNIDNKAVPGELTPASKSILIVEDSVLVRQWTTDILVKAGFEVIEREDMWVSKTVADQQPSLILMDIGLGSANSGIIAAKSLKQSLAREIPILFYSSKSEKELKAAVQESGADGFIQKDNNEQALLASIVAQIGQP